MNYLSLCCIVKDEDLFIGEWLAYHSLLGVEHFYLYDNESATPLVSHPMVAAGLEQGRITVMEIEGRAKQLPAYNHCLTRFGAENRWIGFLDADEFVCFADMGEGSGAAPDLRLLLAAFEPYAALVLNWRIMGSSGHISRPAGPVIKNYTEALEEPTTFDLHIKSIVRPDFVLGAATPHSFQPAPGKYAVDEHFRPVSPAAPVAPLSRDAIWINHYLYKSQQDLEAKHKRGRADITSARFTVPYEQFYRQADAATVYAPQAAKLAGQVEALLAANALALPPTLRPIPQAQPETAENAMPERENPVRRAPDGGYPPPELRDSPQAWLDAATKALLEQGAHGTDKAEQILAGALARHHGHALLWTMRGYAARHGRRFEDALFYLRKSITLLELPQTYEELFHLALAMNDTGEARRILFYLHHTPHVRLAEPIYSKKLSLLDKALAAQGG